MIALLPGVLQAITRVDAPAAAGTGRPVLELITLLRHNNSTNDPHQAATIKLMWVAEITKATDRNRAKGFRVYAAFFIGDIWHVPSFHLCRSVFCPPDLNDLEHNFEFSNSYQIMCKFL